MERVLLILGGALTLVMLLYVVAAKNVEQPADLTALSQIEPEDDWFKDKVLKSEKPVLVEFTADWCGYCKQLAVVLKDIEKDYGDRISIIPVDVDEHPNVAAAYQITGLPTVFVVKAGKVVAYAPGMMRYETIEGMIKPHLGPATSSRQNSDTPAEESPQEDGSTVMVTSLSRQ